MNRDGQNFTGFPVNIVGGIECTPVVGKFDGDNCGVIFGDTTGKRIPSAVTALNPQTSPSPSVETSRSPQFFATLIAIVIKSMLPADTGFNAVDIKRNIQSLDWFCYRARTAVPRASISPFCNNDPVIPVAVNALNGNYPNPFNPTTTISFSIKDSSPVEYRDIQSPGSESEDSPMNQPMTAGSHSVVWNRKRQQQPKRQQRCNLLQNDLSSLHYQEKWY